MDPSKAGDFTRTVTGDDGKPAKQDVTLAEAEAQLGAITGQKPEEIDGLIDGRPGRGPEVAVRVRDQGRRRGRVPRHPRPQDPVDLLPGRVEPHLPERARSRAASSATSRATARSRPASSRSTTSASRRRTARRPTSAAPTASPSPAAPSRRSRRWTAAT
ncbi:hypothetical protein [Clavibacter zhangzhiyongii]|uniref:hypothetical protein n=1 Tax=Clavibacter zhangzhiyongii TaxID=2768071 RepID=UPI0039E13341